MGSSAPQCQPGSSDEVEEEQLLLSPDQVALIDAFRRDVRRCGTDEDKFHLCAEARGRLLEQHTRVELLIALFERVMLAECPGYRSCKRSKENAARTQVDAKDEWDHFIGVAANGSDMIRKCLPHLKAVSVRWGRERLQHYNWPARGWLFCKKLGAVANRMAWPEFTVKANQLLLRRAQMAGKLRRRGIRESPDPLDLVGLENLGRWAAEGPYIKDKDPENAVLPFEELSGRDLPRSYSFDRYGLMVRCQFGHSIGASPAAVSDLGGGTVGKIWDDVVPVPEQDAGLPGPLGSENSEHSSSGESPADSCAPSPPRHSRLPAPLSSPPDSPAVVDPGRATRKPTETVPGGDDNNSDSGLARDEERCARILCPTSTASLARLRPRQDNKPGYREAPPKNAKPAGRRPGPPASLDLPAKRCCPPKIPPELLVVLDGWDASTVGRILRRTFMSPDVPLEDMCSIHLRRFAQAVKSPPPGAETGFQAAGLFDRATVSSRRRRASLPDLSGVGPLKRPRLSEQQHTPACSNLPTNTRPSAFPTPDLIRHEAYRRRALEELATTQHKPDSWGRKTDKLVSQILHRIRSPTHGKEAYFLSGEEAARRVELGSLDAPVFTQGQQRFQWPGRDRPIEQLFRYMGDLGLDRDVSVQVPSRSVRDESFDSKTLQQVRDRFLNQESTDDPWNLLDLQTSLPSVLPAFLEGENCQLLRRVRDAALMGRSAERIAASGRDWSTWRNVMEWGLASEGGHNTAPHMDSHGYSTWITVQEGHVGFGWMSRPSTQQEAEWMSRPHSHVAGEWRFVVLSPGQTVFFPSGTIHLVFRTRGTQTYAQGGHVLQWTDLVRWLEVVVAQVQNEDSTNEDMASGARRLVHLVKGLVANRTKAGRVEELGGRDAVDRFLALVNKFDTAVAALDDSES
ncbi:hypothetical protein RB595_003775 [Gaeumannomyces hyphopodioides]